MLNKEVVALKMEITSRFIKLMAILPEVVDGLAFDASDEGKRIASNNLLEAIKILNDINKECLTVGD